MFLHGWLLIPWWWLTQFAPSSGRSFVLCLGFPEALLTEIRTECSRIFGYPVPHFFLILAMRPHFCHASELIFCTLPRVSRGFVDRNKGGMLAIFLRSGEAFLDDFQ